VAALIAAGLVVLDAAPAAADARVEVEAGYVDGQIVPGRPVPVRVEVHADQLLTGTLSATAYLLGNPQETVTVPIEVAGGSVKDYLVVVPTRWDGAIGPAEMRVVVRGGDETVEGSTTLAWSGQVEVVGLLPGLVPQAPDPLPLAVDAGRAMFSQLDDALLATPGALAPLGTIVAGPDGLGSLAPEAQANVLRWVDEGGQLIVDVPAGAPVAGLPAAWQPDGTRQPAGEGWVRLGQGAAVAGRWAELIEPTRQFSPQELMPGGMCCFTSVPDAIARDAGLRIPRLGWLLGFLVAYIVIVGPVTFFAVRRLRRTGLAWVAIPVVAVVFTVVAFGAGSSLRAGARASHGSLVQASPVGDRVVSYVGLVSRDGDDPTALFPEDWQAGPFTASGPFAGSMPMPEGGAVDAVVPVDGVDGRGVGLRLGPGDFGVVTGRGRIEQDSLFSVEATAAADGTVAGTVTNHSEADLEAVMVAVAGQAVSVGGVAAGATAEWTVDASGPGRRDPWAPVEAPWSSATGFNEPPDPDSPVNYAVYASEIAGDVDTYAPGTVLAAGWTDDWAPPVEVGAGVADGRTGFVARAPIAAAPGSVPAAAVRREFVRGTGPASFDQPVQIPGWGDALGAIARFTLPAGADPATPLVVDTGGQIVQAEAWDGQRWVPLALGDAPAPGAGDAGAAAGDDSAASGGAGAGDTSVATILAPPMPGAGAVLEQVPPGGVGGVLDPTGPPRVASLPASAVRDGVVYVRVAFTPDMGPNLTLQLGEAA
jgi:hypothetical protein